MSDETKTYTPHPGAQHEFCTRGEFEVLFGGAAGPGKTFCLILDAIRYIAHPNYRAIIFRRTFPQLQEIIDRCFEIMPLLGGVYRATEHRWYFESGATLQLGHMQHENDRYNYHGKQYHFCGFDELTLFLEIQYLFLFSRVRSVVPELPAKIRSTTNPGGIGHNWVKDRFIDVVTPGETYFYKVYNPKTCSDDILSRCYIPATYEDNPTLFENDPGYLSRLSMLPEIERLRLIKGRWDLFEGQVFTELSKSVHGHEPFDIPEEWNKFMAFDWGFVKPFSVGWYAVDPDGIIYRYREWYGCVDGKPDTGLRKSATDVARGILERESERVRIRVADPSIWNKTPLQSGAQGPSVQENMRQEGIYFRKADNDRMQGKMQVHQRFVLDPVFDKKDNKVGERPRCYIFNTCTHFWRTMEILQYSEKRPEDVETDKQEDHIYDEFRYACQFRPLKVRKKKPELKPNTFQYERRKLIAARNMAKRKGISLEKAYQRI